LVGFISVIQDFTSSVFMILFPNLSFLVE